MGNEWEAQYAQGRHHSIWPWTDVISLVRRHCVGLYGSRVLELGCGMGANRRFIESIGGVYYGIEASETAFKFVHGTAQPHARERLARCDFTKGFPFAERFHLIFDRASVTHNNLDAVTDCVQHIYDALAADGVFIGVDWYSTRHRDPEQFAEIGTTTLFDEGAIRILFQKFKLISLEEKVIERAHPLRGQFASWNFVAKK